MIQKKNLFRPPVLRTSENQGHERKVTWLELFFDLAFVAAIASLAEVLSHHYSVMGFLQFAFIFVMVWWAWIGQTYYLTRFDTDDLTHRVTAIFKMLSVVCLAVSATGALGERSIEFALSYAAIRIILVIEYLRAGYYNGEAKPLVNRFALGFSISILLWLVSLFVPAPYRFFIWALAIVIDYLTPITAGDLHAKFPPHIHHLPERFGLFTIIVLGEIIVDIVIALNKTGLTLYSVTTAFFGIVIGFIIWGLYFDGVHAAESRVLNNSNEVNKYQVWLYSHLPLTMGITSTAVGIKHLIYLKYPISMNEGETLLFILSIVLTAFCLNFIFLSQPNIGFNKDTWKKIAPHFYINIVMLLMIFLIPYLAGIAILGLITFVYSLKIFYSYKYSNK